MSKLDRVLAAARQNGGGLTVPQMIEIAGLAETAALRREVLHEMTCLPEWRNVGNDPETRRTLWRHISAYRRRGAAGTDGGAAA